MVRGLRANHRSGCWLRSPGSGWLLSNQLAHGSAMIRFGDRIAIATDQYNQQLTPGASVLRRMWNMSLRAETGITGASGAEATPVPAPVHGPAKAGSGVEAEARPVQHPKPQVALAVVAVGARQRPSGQLHAGRAHRLRRERDRLGPYQLQLG